VQSGEVVNGQTYSQSDIDRCNQIQQIIYYTMISPNDLAWLLSNNTEAFTDIATYVSNGDRTPLQLQGVSAYIRLLVQGRVNISLREFMPKYQIVFGELVPVLGLTEEEAEYLMDNEELTDAITQFLEEYNDIEGKQAAVIILQIHRQGLLTGPYAELQRDYIIESFWHLTPDQYAEFVIQCIILKQQWQNANQGENCDNYCTYKIALKAYWNTLKGYVHTALDICGLIPVAGEPCDLINGTLYLVQGDGVNASLSFAGALPVVGWAATGAKYALILVATADGVKTFKVVWDNIVSLFKFPLPSETSFRKIVGVTDPDFQAHHVIPQGLYGHPAIQKAAQAANTPWHMHHPKNGIGVHINRHNGSHNNYNTQVELFLNSIDVNLPPDEISQIIINKQNEWRIFIDASSDHINQIILP
jgi:hypothetical protein